MNITFILSILAAISAILFLRANQRRSKRQEYIFKPLTTLLILLIALLGPAEENVLYKWAITVGLALSLAGDIFLLLPRERFIYGLVSFLIAHIFFIVAFASEGFSSSILVFIPFAIYGIIILVILRPHLGKLLLPAIIYALALMVMGWQAAGRWTDAGSQSSMLALLGALLFIFSDSIMMLHRFRSPHPNARLLYMSLYYLALWLLAISVVLY